MDSRAPALRQPAAHLVRFAIALVAALALILPAVSTMWAASPDPSPSPQANPDVNIDARALLGGHVRPGAWTAVEVLVSNDGPAITGELRIRGPQQGRSQYGVEASLPTGARQQFTLYAQAALFGSRLNVDLVSGEQVLATKQVTIKSHDAYSPIVAVIAEHPEGILPAVNRAMTNPNTATATVIQLTIADLPPRIEAWAAIDRLVWQDVDAAQLTAGQRDALRLWIGAGGRLVVLGGTTGVATVRGFGDDLLPFTAGHTVDAAPADLASLLGAPPAGAVALPAIAGTLNHGAVLARSGDDIIAAEVGYGQGVVTLIGIDPSAPWIADSGASGLLWNRLLPQMSGPVLNPLVLPDDSQIVYALQNLPSVALPPIEQLLVLLVAYIVLIGPVNYLVLRRLDKREWAWVTIPALVAVFAASSYGLGATLKGSDVIVNQITIVRASQGSTRGIGQAYVGIYSPSRRSFDVHIPGGALLSNPTSQAMMGQTETPLDVLFGESTSRLRNFEVGFGVLRGFRAEAPAEAPAIESNLRLVAGRLQGTVTNRSESPLENVAVLFAGDVAVISDMAAGESRTIDLDTTTMTEFGFALSERVFGSTFPRDPIEARAAYTRRAVIDQLFPWGTTSTGDAPLLLAWRDGPVLDVELPTDRPNQVGEGLFMIPLAMELDPHQVFANTGIRRTIVEMTAADGWGDISGFYLSRGTMTIETRPTRFDGTFRPTSLEIALTQGEGRRLNGNGQLLEPLPDLQQPDQDDPLGDPPAAVVTGGGDAVPDCPADVVPCNDVKPPEAAPADPMAFESLPAFQLFDRVDQRWLEFPHPDNSKAYLIAEPGNYVDSAGAVLFRFVNRGARGEFGEEQRYFQIIVRLEGTIE